MTMKLTVGVVIAFSPLFIDAYPLTVDDCKTLINDREKIVAAMDGWSNKLLNMSLEVLEAEWAWSNNMTLENQRKREFKKAAFADFRKIIWRTTPCFDCSSTCSEEERRRLDSYRRIGTSALPSLSYKDLAYVESMMKNIHATAKVCRRPTRCMSLYPNLTSVMANSNNYCQLLWVWKNWRDKTGPLIRPYYSYYVHMLNEAALKNGMRDARQMWTQSYVNDEPNFFAQMEAAWQTVLPLYEQLHALVRRKLMEKYGRDKFPANGFIPAHLLGNMWAQDWSNLYDLVTPDKTVAPIDVTKLLKENKYTVQKMFQLADELFISIGMQPMTNTFWEKSVFKKVKNVPGVCHASAWDFYRRDDFRIKMCTNVDQANFLTIHHEMGHIQYYMHYKDLPLEFRQGANPGFHEAIGDLVALSVNTPTHLKAIKLLSRHYPENEGMYLNALMKSALQKIAFLPFGYLIDNYRWMVFERKIPSDRLNTAWWQQRCQIQGVSPPIQRSENDFDAASKFHVAAFVPYIRYFFSHIVQYQIHVSLCKEMGITKNFHKCDIYGNITAARKLREAMELGSSRPYPEVLQILTGNSELNATALLEYYDPLYQWLLKQNNGYKVGWEGNCLADIPKSHCILAENGADLTHLQPFYSIFLCLFISLVNIY